MVLEALLYRAAFFVRPHEPGGGECRGLRNDSKKLHGRPVAREDDVQRAEVANRQPPGIHNAGTDWPRGLREDDRFGTPRPKLVPAIAAGFELLARLAEAPRALGHPQGWTVLLLDREADTRRDHLLAGGPKGTHTTVVPHETA